MATPAPELLLGGKPTGGGRGVDSAANVALSSSASRAAVAISEEKSSSPILVFLYFHKAVRNELDLLHSSAMDFATGQPSDLCSLRERYGFLRLIYKHHCDAEEEVIFPALDKRVKNVVQTYSLEHKGESNLFDHLFELLTSSEETDESFPRELAFCAGALRTSVSQHLAKEETQVFPLLVEKFSHAEQAFIVWRFLCSIPVNMLAELLPWISSSISADECMEMRNCLWKIVPDEKLLQQVVCTWTKREIGSKGFSKFLDEGCLHLSPKVSTCQTGGSQSACALSKTRKRKYLDSTNLECDNAQTHPIDEILLWHNAISKELHEIVREARKIQKIRDFADISDFDERLQFVTEVCIYHSIARDKVLYPTGSREFSFSQERDEEENQFNMIRSLIESIKSGGAASSTSELYTKLCSRADQIVERIQKHFYKEEVQVLPHTRKRFSSKRQQELLYQRLCVMPLRLIERVLPWLVASSTEDEARNFLTNLQEGAPPTDACLVTLFSGWACKGLCLSPTGNGCYPVKRSRDVEVDCWWPPGVSVSVSCVKVGSVSNHGSQHKNLVELDLSVSCGKCEESNSLESVKRPLSGNACVPGLGINSNCLGISSLSDAKSIRCSSLSFVPPSLSSSLFIWGTDNNNSSSGNSDRPIDTIFKFHKAISKDLEYLDAESGKLMDCDDTFLRQFILRFHLLWGFYKAHSNAEDEIVFPALESKETLHNVSHSYTLDHKHEEKLFEDIYAVLSELSVLHENMRKDSMMEGLPETGTVSADTSSSYHKKRYNDLVTKLQGMCKSIKITLDQHIFLEELELWPLFDKHFSIKEQDKIVGHIIGTTGAEVLQSMLPWVTSALTRDEQNSMMDTWKQATKNTMFDEWLDECWKDHSQSSSLTETSKSVLLGDEDLHEFLDQDDKMFKPGWKDIFRMNQNELEAEIRKVYRDLTLDPRRKAYLVQNLMTSRWIAAQQKLPQTTATATLNSDAASDCCPSFQDPENKVFGCEHYKRNCKLVAACCGRLFTCRFCHDKVSDHSMDRKTTSEMMCMRCLKVQPIGPICTTPSCNGLSMGKYYCNICKLFEDERSVYHCPFCNLCRVGKGLGIDYFHCMTCNCCLGMKLVNHKCLEKSLETNCPICCEFLFTSSEAVRALPCGHYMHSACFQAYTCSHYTCPICGKSLGDMGVYFGMLDALLATEELPDEYKNRCQDILCNDCERKGNSRFHWLYHKCGFCGSYNTRVIKTDTSPPPICSTST